MSNNAIKAFCVRVIAAACLLVSANAALAELPEQLTAKIDSLKAAIAAPLPDDAETSAIVQRRRDELELLTLETFNANSREITLCDYHLAAAADAQTLADKISPQLQKFSDYLGSLDRQISNARIDERYAILALDKKLEKLKPVAKLQAARAKLALAGAMQAAGDSENPRRYAEQAFTEAQKLLTSESKQAAFKALAIAARAKAACDFPQSIQMLKSIASSDDIDIHTRLSCCFDLAWNLAVSSDFNAAQAWASQFDNLVKKAQNTNDNRKDISLEIYAAILNEHILYKRAEFMQLTGGASVSEYEKLAGKQLEALFVSHADESLALAKILSDSFSSPQRKRRHPALFYSRGLLAIEAGNLQQAKFWLDRCGENYRSDYFHRQAVWKLIETFAGAALQSEDAAQRTQLYQQAAQYCEFFTRHWPGDLRCLQAVNILSEASSLAKKNTSQSYTETLEFLAQNTDDIKFKNIYLSMLAERYSREPNPQLEKAADCLRQIIAAGDGAKKTLATAKYLKIKCLIAAQSGNKISARQYISELEKIRTATDLLNFEVQTHLAECYLYGMGDTGKAIEIVKGILPADINTITSDSTRNFAPAINVYLRSLLKTREYIPAALFMLESGWATVLQGDTAGQEIFNSLTSEMTRKILVDIASGSDKKEYAATLAKLLQSQDIRHFSPLMHAQLTIALCQSGKLAEASEQLALVQSKDENPPELILARAIMLNKQGSWRQAVEQFHKLLPQNGLSSKEYDRPDVWLIEALLARCIYDNTADNPTERRRLSLRLRQLRLRDENFGGLKEIFDTFADLQFDKRD